MNLDPTLVALLIPVVVLQVGLVIAALWDLTRPGRRVRGDSRLVWGVIVVLVNLIGPVLYFVVGREESVVGDEELRVDPTTRAGAVAGWQAPTLSAAPAVAVAESPAAAPPPVAEEAAPERPSLRSRRYRMDQPRSPAGA